MNFESKTQVIPKWEYSEAEYLARDMLLSMFLRSKGNTSAWSVTTTSQPSRAIPANIHYDPSKPIQNPLSNLHL